MRGGRRRRRERGQSVGRLAYPSKLDFKRALPPFLALLCPELVDSPYQVSDEPLRASDGASVAPRREHVLVHIEEPRDDLVKGVCVRGEGWCSGCRAASGVKP